MASRTCWNCERDAHQTLRGMPIREFGPVEGVSEWFGFYQCDQCGYASIGQMALDRSEVSTQSYGLTEVGTHSSVYERASRRLSAPDASPRWLPEHVLGRRFADVPTWIADAASEAYACYSIRSYRGAILLARSVVEAVAKDKGVTTGNLAAKIDKLADGDHIRPLIKDTAHEIRHLGNDMAHGDFVEPVTAEDADDMLDFMSVILAEVYQLPAQVNARKATREARKVAAAARKAEESSDTA